MKNLIFALMLMAVTSPLSAGELYLSVYTHNDKTEAEAKIIDNFQNAVSLVEMKRLTTFNLFEEYDMTEHHHRNFPVLPVVILQEKQADGSFKEMHRVSGSYVPTTALGMHREFSKYIESPARRRSKHRRGDCVGDECYAAPTPEPEPEPDPVDVAPPAPVVEEESAVPTGVIMGTLLGIAALSVLAGIIGVIVAKIRHADAQ